MKIFTLLIILVSFVEAISISTREISKNENQSQIRMFIQQDDNELNSVKFKAYYYIKGSNLKVVDNYTPLCSLYVEKITNEISRVILDYNSYNLPNIIPNTSGIMFTIYSEDDNYNRKENPSHIESNFFRINDSIDIIDENGVIIHGDPERVNRFVSMVVSPNPVDDVMNITYSGDNCPYSFEIINSSTQKMVKSFSKTFEIEDELNVDLSDIPKTSYTLLVKRGGVVVKRVLFYKN